MAEDNELLEITLSILKFYVWLRIVKVTDIGCEWSRRDSEFVCFFAGADTIRHQYILHLDT